MSLEIYEESYWEVFNPQDARIVAHFFNEDDAKAYVDWRESVVQPPEKPKTFADELAAFVNDPLGWLGRAINGE